MRATKRQQTGAAGETYVKWTFEQLGWGVATNPDSDLGTDLFAMARDERLFDLGLVVGVQVKSGQSWFDEPAYNEKGELRGYWFRDDDREHIDSWLRHGLPHLIVLHNPHDRVCYWEHVKDEVVESTGKGAKILVPVNQTIDDEHRNALLEVAAALRPRTGWEGSAWTGADALQPRDLLRYALLAPRLVAPHPNTGRKHPLRAEQAVALLAQARLRDLEAFAKDFSEVPTLSEAFHSQEWPWRFVGAFGHRLTTGESDRVRLLIDDAPSSTTRVASTVISAATFLQEGLADEAVSLLEAELARDGVNPVDHAWLKVHFAQACAEIGCIEEARQAAYDVQQIRLAYPEDVTATAIAGVAAALLFDTARWTDEDLGGLITGMDNAVSWWRTQMVSRGLTALTDRAYRDWARDSSITLGANDTVNNQLVASSLVASHLGDQSAWRHLSGLLGQASLLSLARDTDSDTVSNKLDSLRLTGKKKELKLALKRLKDDGPAIAITQAATKVRLDMSTRTTGRTNLALLQYGGDLLNEETAEKSLSWLLEVLEEPESFIARTRPTFVLETIFLDTLAAILPAAPSSAQHAVVDRLVGLEAQNDQSSATSWARVAEAVPQRLWDPATLARLRNSPIGDHHWALRIPLLGLISSTDHDVKAQLVREALDGSQHALVALGDSRELDEEVAGKLIDGLTEQIGRQIAEAHNGKHSFGGGDKGRTLAVLNIWHPSVAKWSTLFQLLEDAAVFGQHKIGALRVCTASVERLSGEVKHRLGTIAKKITKQSPPKPFLLMGDTQDAIGAATELASVLGAFDEQTTVEQMVALLAGERENRRWAARVAGQRGKPEDVGLLTALALDQDPAVRATAASQLAFMVTRGLGGALAESGLRLCLRDPGTLVAVSVALTLEHAPTRTQSAIDALTELRTHPSARVRSAAESSLTA